MNLNNNFEQRLSKGFITKQPEFNNVIKKQYPVKLVEWTREEQRLEKLLKQATGLN